VNNSCFIGNIHGVTTANNDAVPVLIDSADHLGTMNSSRRYETDIKLIEKVSESIPALKPVSSLQGSQGRQGQFGLIAADVAQVNPDLVIYDVDGTLYTIRYNAVNAMLLNEFLKEHRKIEEQEATIGQLRKDLQVNVARQEKQIEALTAGLQKVSAELEARKSAPQTVLNDR